MDELVEKTAYYLEHPKLCKEIARNGFEKTAAYHTYPTNYIFVFDSELVQTFRSNGLTTFYYMPLPVNGTAINHLLSKPYLH